MANPYTHRTATSNRAIPTWIPAIPGATKPGTCTAKWCREKVATWPIAYSCLTDDEYKYTIGLFAGKATFQFTHPKAGLFHRDRNHHLLLQQIRHRLAQCQDETVEEFEVQYYRMLIGGMPLYQSVLRLKDGTELTGGSPAARSKA